MGVSSKSSKSSTKPVYAPQIENSAATVTNAYNAAAPGISATTNALSGLVPDLVKQYQQGSPNVQAAQSYNTDVLNGKYLDAGNPYLQAQIDATGSDVRNGLTASLGTRGLTGGSAFGDIITRNLANNATNLRYTDYSNERGRMDTAAGQAAGISAAQYQPISAIQSILQSQLTPLQAAQTQAAGIGGLLGQYTNQKQTYNPSLMDSISQGLNIGKSVAGFF